MGAVKREFHDEICAMNSDPLGLCEPMYEDFEEYRRERDIAIRYADSMPHDADAINALNWLNGGK